MWKLHIEDDEGQETVVPIIRDEITIGRQEGNTIRLTERNVSRKHARLVREEGKIFLEEVAARYGIRKNGALIEEREEFTPDDVFLIGDYRLTLKTDKPAVQKESRLNGADASGDFKDAKTEIKPLGGPPARASEGTEILPAMPAKLVIISSNFAGQEFPLARKEMVIGRGEECDIIIDHRSVSQKHAKIVREHGGTYQIVDINSKNGVRISGDKYTSTHLKRGDVIELGHVKFRFVEPGENYVFTPQTASSDPAPISSAPGKSKAPLIGGAILAVVAVVAIIAFAMSQGDKDTPPTPGEGGGGDAIASTNVGDGGDGGDDSGDALPATNDKVKDGIARAEKQIERGEIDKAISLLEGLKEYANPSAEDKKRIEELLSKSRREAPFQKTYIVAQDDLKTGKYRDALANLMKIPDHSLFHKLIEEGELRDEAIAGMLKQGQAALSDGRRSEASELVDAILTAAPEHPDALALQRKLDEKRVASNSKTKKDPTRTPPDKKPPKKKEPKLTRAEAQALVKQANKKLFQGDPDGAIEDCRRALKAGQRDCHRIMGIAYKLKGNKPKACKSFQRALNGNPPNAPAIKQQMSQLGCD